MQCVLVFANLSHGTLANYMQNNRVHCCLSPCVCDTTNSENQNQQVFFKSYTL